MLGLNPDGTVSGSLGSRLLPSILVRADYLAATIALLYVGNLTERELPRRRLEQLLALMFVWVVLGGVLGILLPTLQFTSPIELLLPSHFRSNNFVQSLVHPVAAQLQSVLGYESPRPSAPWGYTNIWGNNFAILSIWFVYFLGTRIYGGQTTRFIGALIGVVGLIVAALSLNRGLWIGLSLATVYLLVRLAARGSLAGVTLIVAGVVVCVVLAGLTPIGSLVLARFETGKSNEARSFTVSAAFPVIAQSPVLGFGNTRDALGSGQSIAVGRTSDCPRCGNLALGSNGQLWFMLIGQGIIGALAYIAFYLRSAWVYRRDRSALGLAGGVSVLLPLWFMFVYNAAPSPLFFQFLTMGMLWRYGIRSDVTTNASEAQVALLRTKRGAA